MLAYGLNAGLIADLVDAGLATALQSLRQAIARAVPR
jgi:hypothetical protein